MQLRTITLKVRIFVEPDDDQYYAYCPDLKGLHVGGCTEEEALRNAQDAADAYLTSCLKSGDPIPVGVISSDETRHVSELLRECLSRFLPSKRRSHVAELHLASA